VASVRREGRELIYRHGEFAHSERLRDGHDVLRALVIGATSFIRGGAHSELPRRHHDHLRAGGAFLEGVLQA